MNPQRIVPWKRTSASVLSALILAAIPAAAFAHPPDAPGTPEVVASFNPAALETPESIVFDRDGNIYLSLALTGEIRKIATDGTQSSFAFLPIGAPLTPCGGFLAIMGGLTIDNHGNLYAAVASCDPANRGIWRISPAGQAQLLSQLPIEALPNGITLHHDHLYVADSALGRVWAVPVEGGPAEVWIQDDSLFAPVGSPFPGANGIKAFRGEVYVSVSGAGTIIAIPFLAGDAAGAPRVHAVLPAPQGCDDFAFDVHGSLYCTTDPFRTVIRVDPDGSSEILLTAADGLDGPTATAFGVHGDDRFNLYITNAAFPFFSETHQPSLMRVHLGVVGAPIEH
ncbi:MAG: SMP-30/gluconolactonase/LRE family protein [Thermoanaerobaculia bacterium]